MLIVIYCQFNLSWTVSSHLAGTLCLFLPRDTIDFAFVLGVLKSGSVALEEFHRSTLRILFRPLRSKKSIFTSFSTCVFHTKKFFSDEKERFSVLTFNWWSASKCKIRSPIKVNVFPHSSRLQTLELFLVTLLLIFELNKKMEMNLSKWKPKTSVQNCHWPRLKMG